MPSKTATQNELIKQLVVDNPHLTPEAIAKKYGVQAHKVALWQPRAMLIGKIHVFVELEDEYGNLVPNYALNATMFADRVAHSQNIYTASKMAGINWRMGLALWPKFISEPLSLEELWELYPLLLLPKELVKYANLNDEKMYSSFVSPMTRPPTPERLLERALNLDATMKLQDIKSAVTMVVNTMSQANFPPVNNRLSRALVVKLVDDGVFDLESGKDVSTSTLVSYLHRALNDVNGTVTVGEDKYDYKFAVQYGTLSAWVNWHNVPINTDIHGYSFAFVSGDNIANEFIEHVAVEYNLKLDRKKKYGVIDDDLPFTYTTSHAGKCATKHTAAASSDYVTNATNIAPSIESTSTSAAAWATTTASLPVQAFVETSRELMFGETDDSSVALDACLQLTDREVSWLIARLFDKIKPEWQLKVKKQINKKD